MINKRFLNFKTYNGFLAKKDEIPEDSIVFIQDKPCIWARGKEYVCDGPLTSSVENNTLTFTNGKDETIFEFEQKGGTITVKDSRGYESSATYVLSSEVADVAFSGSYSDLKDKPTIVTVDQYLDSQSENAVQNKAIYTALQGKAASSDLNNYVTTSTYNTAMGGKQDKLVADADSGISIYIDPISNQTKIKSTLDVSVYEFVTTKPDISEANPNKIYILEIANEDGSYRYEQYRVRNNRWVSLGSMSPQVDLEEYLKSADADTKYQPIGEYLTSTSLNGYATIETDINPIWTAFNDYALKSYVDNEITSVRQDFASKDWVTQYFVQKAQVYYSGEDIHSSTPVEEDPSESGSGSGTGSSSGSGTTYNIVVDKELNRISPNPVQNSTVTLAIKNLQDTKADKTYVQNNYASKSDLDSKVDNSVIGNYVRSEDVAGIIAGKQDILQAGRGINITDNTISSTLDTEVYIFVKDELPAEPSGNKIYILERETEGVTEFTQWRWDTEDQQWESIGAVIPEVDLSGYLTINDASRIYALKGDYAMRSQVQNLRTDVYNDLQPKGEYASPDDIDSVYQRMSDNYNTIYQHLDNNYLTESEVDANFLTKLQAAKAYQPKRNDYVITEALDTAIDELDNTYQVKGDFPLRSEIKAALNRLQEIIDEKYVLKSDVYNPDNAQFGTTSPVDITVDVEELDPADISYSRKSRMITLTAEQYEYLVRNNLTDSNTYYFTYESKSENDTYVWHFGEPFPITLTYTWEFGGTFPITLS